MIEGGASPDAATERLIEEPAIHHEINGENWSLDLNRGEEPIPPIACLFERAFDVICIAILLNQAPGVIGIIRLPEHTNYGFFFAGAEFKFGLQSAAGIEARTDALRKRFAAQSDWGLQGAIAADEKRAIPCVTRRLRRHGGEGDAAAIIQVIWIAHQ